MDCPNLCCVTLWPGTRAMSFNASCLLRLGVWQLVCRLGLEFSAPFSVQSGERDHGLTKMRMRFSPHGRYRWHRHGVSEDVRVFAGNRFNPGASYYDNWLAGLDHKRSILGPATDGGCTGCGRSVCVECPYVCMTPHVAKEDEHNIRLVPPLCRGCWLRLLIHRQGVGTPALRGFVGIVKE